MQLELKKFDDAILTLQQARHRFPVPQMTYSLAVALSTAKRYPDALPIYEAALQEAKTSQPEVLDAAFYFNYAVAAEQSNLVDKAAGLMSKKALELQPDDGAYIDSLGWYYYHTGEYAKALTELLRALEKLKPEDPVVLEHVGDTYQALNNLGEAER